MGAVSKKESAFLSAPCVLYSATAETAGASQPEKQVLVPASLPYAFCQVSIGPDIDGSTNGAVTVKIQGRMSSSDNWVDLKRGDDSTATTVTQASGAQTDAIFKVQLMPRMRVVTAGTHDTSGHAIRVALLAAVEATVTNS